MFFRTPTFATRLQLTDELLRAVLPKRAKKDGGHDHPAVKEWSGIHARIDDLLATRNALAHQPRTSYANIVVQLSQDNQPPKLHVTEPGTSAIMTSQKQSLRSSRPKVNLVLARELPGHHAAAEDIVRKVREFSKNTTLLECLHGGG